MSEDSAVDAGDVRCARCGDTLVWHHGNGGQWLGAEPPRDFMNCGGVADGSPHVSEREDAAYAAGRQAGIDQMVAVADVLELKWAHDQAGYLPKKLGAAVVRVCRNDLAAAFSPANRVLSIFDLPSGGRPGRRGSSVSEPVTPQMVAALRATARSMPLSHDGGPWQEAARWVMRRADAFEESLGEGAGPADGSDVGD